jgi:flagellin FlaB
MKRMNTEEGFTGLEAAIVLIAFVVVAAVFSYVVLGAGFFTTQKAQEVVYTSVDQASSSVEILGQVYGFGKEEAGNYTGVDSVQFKVGLTAGGSPVDFSMTTLTFSTDEEVYRLEPAGTSKVTKGEVDPGEWGVIEIFNSNAEDLLLENQEQFVILAKTKSGSELVANQPFNLEIRPSVGASYAISRKITPSITAVNVLN